MTPLLGRVLMEWQRIYAHDEKGIGCYGSLQDLLLCIRDGEQIGIVHTGIMTRRFFPVEQVLIKDSFAYAVVHTAIHNAISGKDGKITWQTKPGGTVSVYCSNGMEYWDEGKISTSTPLDWYALTNKFFKNGSMKKSRLAAAKPS